MEYGAILLETFFGFIILFILAKSLGKTQIKQLTAFDFISVLILGELVGNGLYDKEVGILHMGFAVILWGVLLYVTEIITQKYKKSRSLLEGSPSIMIHKGKIQREQMRKAKLDMNQLLHLLRSKGVFSVKEVEYAILETDGTVSVLKKTNYQSPVRKDFNLPLESVALTFMIINDGEILYDNLSEIGYDKAWLEEELKKEEVYSIRDVFYAEYDKNNGLYIQGF
ncbi:DUF421 domain-containing protein [Gracilibacillus dipsosauri]|uniref:DUF421 domain-containing protein n=1 Tax=Gracilibacillus dipsosauri TaxID=178340 RepID=UPI00240900C8